MSAEFFKEALNLYMKTSVKTFPENIEFKPCQISILEEVEIPTERKLIWVVGKSGVKTISNISMEINYLCQESVNKQRVDIMHSQF